MEHGTSKKVKGLSSQSEKEDSGLYISKDVPVYVWNPSKKNYRIFLRLKNAVGVIAELSELLRRMSISISGGVTSVYDGEGSWSFFAESSLNGPTAEEVSAALRRSTYVIEATVEEDLDGFLVDSTFPLRWNTGERAVLIRQAFLVSMLDSIREKFGSVGEAIIYEEGVMLGREGFKEMVARLGQDFAKSHLDLILRLYSAVGWGRVEMTYCDLLKQKITVRVIENFECCNHTSDKPYSRFFKGHLVGAFSAIMGKETTCTETKCVSLGDSFCEFTVTTSNER